MRLDYLFATPALAALVRECRIVDGGETDVASDHYPVVADVDLDPPSSA
jgi:exonuclease III